MHDSTFENVLDMLVEKGATFGTHSEEQEGRDISFSDGKMSLIVFNLRTHEMTDENNNIFGSVAIFTNVTQNRELLNKLEKKAGTDPLTGVPNRIAFEGARGRFDMDEHFPLAVIMCDANGLKEVNDTLGHNYGDMLLRVMAETLDKARPKDGFVARIGGDEFVYLLSRTSIEGARALIAQLKVNMSKRDDLPFKLSMAMGAAVKESNDKLLIDVIAVADGLMYEDKKKMKMS